MNLDDTLQLAISWAKEIGRIQLSYFRGDQLNISTKTNISDVVTRVDKECEAYLIEEIKKAFPTHSILGEETGMHEGASDYHWAIDPLDGTTNYSQGLPVFTVSIGLQCDNKTVLGVVYTPYLDELYTAVKDKGAFLNGKPIHVSNKTQLNCSVLGTGFPYDKDVNPDNNAANIASLLPHVREIRRMGSAAYDLCCVAAGWLDGYWELSLNLWDVCAGELIVEEAGGEIRSFRKDRGVSIIAANAVIVDKIGEKIK